MKYFIYLCRAFVGSLFVISGMIKANDPLGFGYKLKEYFEEAALNLPALEPYAVELAMLACLAEIVLGFAVIFGGKMKLATTSLVILTVFFGWLTLYTANCDPQGTYQIMEDGEMIEKGVACVDDCGCFGDAFKGSIGRTLTPWESFYKDAVLFIFIVPIFFVTFFGGGIKLNDANDDKIMLPLALIGLVGFSWLFTWYLPVILSLVLFALYFVIKGMRANADWPVAITVALASLIFMWVCYTYLPIKDYRPYAVGHSIPHNMKTAEELGLEPTITYVTYTMVNESNGEEKEVDSDVYMKEKLWEDKAWKIDGERTSESKVRKYGYETPIPDFIMYDLDGNDVTDTLIRNSNKVLLVTNYDTETGDSHMDEIAQLAEAALAEGYQVFGVTASGEEAINEFRHEHQLAFPYFQGDEKVIKTMVRSNPGLMLIDQGTVRAKWSKASVPAMDELNSAMSAK